MACTRPHPGGRSPKRCHASCPSSSGRQKRLGITKLRTSSGSEDTAVSGVSGSIRAAAGEFEALTAIAVVIYIAMVRCAGIPMLAIDGHAGPGAGGDLQHRDGGMRREQAELAAPAARQRMFIRTR